MEGVCIIAHSKAAQALMDSMDIAWGVQYEIARGVSKCWWTWSDVTPERLEKLRGLNKDAALKVPLVLPHSSSTGIYQPELQVWAELDREEKAICEDRHRGLGLQGEWMEAEDWYGGKVQQVALLEEGGNSLHLVLGLMETRKSCRFARFLGSRRLIQVSVSREMLRTHGDTLKDFFKQKFILCGRVFVAFGMKEGKIFLMETQEDYERGSRVLSDARRMSLEEFVNWHNPLDKNGNQAVSKWTTRFDLGLSISVPALAFAPDNMFNIDDDCVNKNPGKAKTEEIYTDGCGYMNGAALSAIGRRMGYRVRPTAVQGRIAGVKGLWVLHLRDRSPDAVPKIWIRSSQTKIKLDLNNLHRAHLIFDLVAPPRVTLPSRLSRLTILNLSHNGVPTRTFVDLMEETLNEQVRSLTRWTHPQDMQLLWATVNRIGHVSASRVQQYALGASRALGLSGRIKEGIYPTDEPVDLLKELLYGELDEEEGTTLLTELETAGAVPQRLRNKSTGEPLTIHGVVMDLLQAGFHPLKLPFLYDKLKKITTDVIEDVIRDFHVTVPLSAEAFIVPDPFGVLKPGQIHFKSSENLKPALEDLHPNIVLGEVLIYRNPNRLPSDVQKVTAIAHEALSDYTDVIVLPTQGPCSFASMLAGGDYDGDVCVCIYDPRLVQGFKNAPLAQQPENFLKDNFEDQGTIEQVAAVAMQMNQMVNDPDARRKKLQDALLSDISQPLIGAYSVFHENAAYVHGYDAPETVRNAFMFNTILDSRKSGLKVKNDVYRRDKQRYDRGRPICLQAGGKGAEGDLPSSVVSLSRPPVLGRFILDELLQEGERMRDFHLHRYDQFIQTTQYSARSDQELLRPYTTASALPDLSQVKSDLTRIRTHVEEHITKWQKTARASKSTPRTPSRRGKTRGGRSAPVEGRNKWRELKKSFATGPDIASDSLLATLGDLEALKASCAYALNPKFAWSVAFQALCRIKATSQGSIALTGTFADSMSISSSAVRVFEQSRLGMS
ncbi:RNA dependent RNA polymerase-domain-containing protein [Trametes gibbosa]|nr:RNA dependent RNA polymerase-domain-containing protein [Trametes gibbosa]